MYLKNGKVKEGYEGRVDFILNELNEALGTEYKLNGNIVESYDEIVNSIDEVIQKKRAEILLSNEEVTRGGGSLQKYLATQS